MNELPGCKVRKKWFEIRRFRPASVFRSISLVCRNCTFPVVVPTSTSADGHFYWEKHLKKKKW